MAKTALISIETLHQLLRCDAEAGKLYWKPRPREMFSSDRSFGMWNTRYAGTEAFTSLTPYGYPEGRIFDRGYRAHRVIWALYYGEWPEEIDHIDHNPANNKINNLRVVDHKTNCKNMKLFKTNKSGVVGVSFCNTFKKWKVTIWHAQKCHCLGSYDNKDEAVAVRKKAELDFRYHKNHGLAKEATQA